MRGKKESSKTPLRTSAWRTVAGDGDAWRLGFTLENLEVHVSVGYASGDCQVVGDSKGAQTKGSSGLGMCIWSLGALPAG